jgi:hypothetical protein
VTLCKGLWGAADVIGSVVEEVVEEEEEVALEAGKKKIDVISVIALIPYRILCNTAYLNRYGNVYIIKLELYINSNLNSIITIQVKP